MEASTGLDKVIDGLLAQDGYATPETAPEQESLQFPGTFTPTATAPETMTPAGIQSDIRAGRAAPLNEGMGRELVKGMDNWWRNTVTGVTGTLGSLVPGEDDAEKAYRRRLVEDEFRGDKAPASGFFNKGANLFGQGILEIGSFVVPGAIATKVAKGATMAKAGFKILSNADKLAKVRGAVATAQSASTFATIAARRHGPTYYEYLDKTGDPALAQLVAFGMDLISTRIEMLGGGNMLANEMLRDKIASQMLNGFQKAENANPGVLSMLARTAGKAKSSWVGTITKNVGGETVEELLETLADSGMQAVVTGNTDLTWGQFAQTAIDSMGVALPGALIFGTMHYIHQRDTDAVVKTLTQSATAPVDDNALVMIQELQRVMGQMGGDQKTVETWGKLIYNLSANLSELDGLPQSALLDQLGVALLRDKSIDMAKLREATSKGEEAALEYLRGVFPDLNERIYGLSDAVAAERLRRESAAIEKSNKEKGGRWYSPSGDALAKVASEVLGDTEIGPEGAALSYDPTSRDFNAEFWKAVYAQGVVPGVKIKGKTYALRMFDDGTVLLKPDDRTVQAPVTVEALREPRGPEAEQPGEKYNPATAEAVRLRRLKLQASRMDSANDVVMKSKPRNQGAAFERLAAGLSKRRTETGERLLPQAAVGIAERMQRVAQERAAAKAKKTETKPGAGPFAGTPAGQVMRGFAGNMLVGEPLDKVREMASGQAPVQEAVDLLAWLYSNGISDLQYAEWIQGLDMTSQKAFADSLALLTKRVERLLPQNAVGYTERMQRAQAEARTAGAAQGPFVVDEGSTAASEQPTYVPMTKEERAALTTGETVAAQVGETIVEAKIGKKTDKGTEVLVGDKTYYIQKEKGKDDVGLVWVVEPRNPFLVMPYADVQTAAKSGNPNAVAALRVLDAKSAVAQQRREKETTVPTTAQQGVSLTLAETVRQRPRGGWFASSATSLHAQYLGTRKLAMFYEGSGPEEVVHEWVHHLIHENLIPAKYMDALYRSYKGGSDWWDTDREEALVYGFLRYVRDGGIGADPSLNEAFKYISGALAHVVTANVGFLNDETRAQFAQWFNKPGNDEQAEVADAVSDATEEAIVDGDARPEAAPRLVATGPGYLPTTRQDFNEWKKTRSWTDIARSVFGPGDERLVRASRAVEDFKKFAKSGAAFYDDTDTTHASTQRQIKVAESLGLIVDRKGAGNSYGEPAHHRISLASGRIEDAGLWHEVGHNLLESKGSRNAWESMRPGTEWSDSGREYITLVGDYARGEAGDSTRQTERYARLFEAYVRDNANLLNIKPGLYAKLESLLDAHVPLVALLRETRNAVAQQNRYNQESMIDFVVAEGASRSRFAATGPGPEGGRFASVGPMPERQAMSSRLHRIFGDHPNAHAAAVKYTGKGFGSVAEGGMTDAEMFGFLQAAQAVSARRAADIAEQVHGRKIEELRGDPEIMRMIDREVEYVNQQYGVGDLAASTAKPKTEIPQGEIDALAGSLNRMPRSAPMLARAHGGDTAYAEHLNRVERAKKWARRIWEKPGNILREEFTDVRCFIDDLSAGNKANPWVTDIYRDWMAMTQKATLMHTKISNWWNAAELRIGNLDDKLFRHVTVNGVQRRRNDLLFLDLVTNGDPTTKEALAVFAANREFSEGGREGQAKEEVFADLVREAHRMVQEDAGLRKTKQLIREFYAFVYDEVVNPVYKELNNGADLNRVKVFLPMMREGGMFLNDDWLGMLSGITPEQTVARREAFANLKTRSLKDSGRIETNVYQVLNNYKSQAAVYAGKQPTIERLGAKLASREVGMAAKQADRWETVRALWELLDRERYSTGRSAPMSPTDVALKFVRTHAVTGQLGASLSNSIVQGLSFFNWAGEVDNRTALAGGVRLLGNIVHCWRHAPSVFFQRGNDNFMEGDPVWETMVRLGSKETLSSFDRHYADMAESMSNSWMNKRIFQQPIRNWLFMGQRMMDQSQRVAAWGASFASEKARQLAQGKSLEFAEKEALVFADDVVGMSMPGTAIMERVGAETGSEWMRMAIPYTSDLMKKLNYDRINVIRPLYRAWKGTEGLPASERWGKIAQTFFTSNEYTNRSVGRRVLYSHVLPVLAYSVIVRGRLPEDWEEVIRDWLSFNVSLVPIIGPPIAMYCAYETWKGGRSPMYTQMWDELGTLVNRAVEGDPDPRWGSKLVEATRFAGLPVSLMRIPGTIIEQRETGIEPLDASMQILMKWKPDEKRFAESLREWEWGNFSKD